MTATQGPRIHSFLETGSGLRVGQATRGRLCGKALCGRARNAQPIWPALRWAMARRR